jgi:RNA polymerase sigma-70 factor (ECF subfamily)
MVATLRLLVSSKFDATESSSTSLTLLQRISTGDKGAWEHFFHRYSPVIWLFARQAGLNAQDSTDMVQEVMLEIAAKAANFEYDASKGRFRGLLKTITQRRVIDRLRRLPRSSRVDADLKWLVDDDSCQVEWQRQEDGVAIRRALELVRAEIEPGTFQAFDLYFLKDVPAKEVARLLSMSEASVYQSRSRVIARLRERLASFDRDSKS